ncbi:hypothetical protein M3Y97_00651100 [Aphelenchoides bicaudatus]|nr:hypothetical protein M3Y97_00651100 [Aphelenchoides bicaudatus]
MFLKVLVLLSLATSSQAFCCFSGNANPDAVLCDKGVTTCWKNTTDFYNVGFYTYYGCGQVNGKCPNPKCQSQTTGTAQTIKCCCETELCKKFDATVSSQTSFGNFSFKSDPQCLASQTTISPSTTAKNHASINNIYSSLLTFCQLIDIFQF